MYILIENGKIIYTLNLLLRMYRFTLEYKINNY